MEVITTECVVLSAYHGKGGARLGGYYYKMCSLTAECVLQIVERVL